MKKMISMGMVAALALSITACTEREKRTAGYGVGGAALGGLTGGAIGGGRGAAAGAAVGGVAGTVIGANR